VAQSTTASLIVALCVMRSRLSAASVRLAWGLLTTGSFTVRTIVVATMPIEQLARLIDATGEPTQLTTALCGFAFLGVLHASMPASLRWKLASLASTMLALCSVGIVARLRTGEPSALNQVLTFAASSSAAFAAAQHTAFVFARALHAVQASWQAKARHLVEELEEKERAVTAAREESAAAREESAAARIELRQAVHDSTEELASARAFKAYQHFSVCRTEWSRQMREQPRDNELRKRRPTMQATMPAPR